MRGSIWKLSYYLIPFFFDMIYQSFPGSSAGNESVMMQETRVQCLAQEDLLEEETATHSSILAGKSHVQRSLAGYSPWGRKRVGHDLTANNSKCVIEI